MLKRAESKQMKMSFVTLEELMPQEHFLRDLDRLVDFDFIYDKVADLYSNTGRPSIDPVVMIKMLLIGYIYGIDSERKLEQDITVNIAYRWFLGIDFDERVPDHSTISQLRRRKFDGTTIFRDVFDEIVRKCIEAGLIDGKLLLTDSTHIRANASNNLREVIEVPDTPSEYIQKLDREAYELGLIKEPVEYDTTKTKEITKSVTDPECGLMKRPGKPTGFHYLNHQTCDSKHGMITDVFVTAGNVHDSTPHTARLEYQIDKFNMETEAICADASYDSGEVHNAMLNRGIKTYIPERKRSGTPNYEPDFDPKEFTYNEDLNLYICPAGKELRYSGYRKKDRRKRYSAKKSDCSSCPYREQCNGKSKNPRTIERSLHEKARAIQRQNINTPEYLAAMRQRKIWCEGNFSHQKERHNLRRTRKRGIERVTEQCLLSACALNLKRLVEILFLLQYSAIIPVRKLFGLFFIAKTWVCQQHRTVHPFAGTEQIVQYRQVMPKRQHLQIIHIGRFELTERFVRSVDEVTKSDGVSVNKGYRESRYPCSASAQYQQPTFSRSGEWISTASCGMIVGREVTAAMKLQDLYYGNIIPCQHDVRKDSDYAKRSLELLEMYDRLEKRLSADDKKLLNDITDMQGMLSETMVAESYIQGFRDCAELITDVMFGRSENLK